MEKEDWLEEYNLLFKNPPIEGDYLYAYDSKGQKILTRLTVSCVTGQDPFIFTRIGLPQIVGCNLSWQTESKFQLYAGGMKCVMLPRTRNALVARHGLFDRTLFVPGLQVIRISNRGTSLLCEVIDV